MLEAARAATGKWWGLNREETWYNMCVDCMLDMILRTLKARGESQSGKKKVVRKRRKL